MLFEVGPDDGITEKGLQMAIEGIYGRIVLTNMCEVLVCSISMHRSKANEEGQEAQISLREQASMLSVEIW